MRFFMISGSSGKVMRIILKFSVRSVFSVSG